MTPSEIISAEVIKQGGDPQKTAKIIMYLLKNKLAIMLHINQSVLLLTQLGDGDVESHLFTADSPMTLFKSLSYFIQKVKESDIRAIYGKAINQQIIEALKRLGIKVDPSDRKEYNWKAVVWER
jgi:hypothetical protein